MTNPLNILINNNLFHNFNNDNVNLIYSDSDKNINLHINFNTINNNNL